MRDALFAQADIDHPGAVVDGITDGAVDGQAARPAVPVGRFEGHDLGPRIDAGNPFAVVGFGGDDAGDKGAVAVVVHDVVVFTDEIPAVNIVHITVAVVIFLVIRDFTGIG